MPVDKNIHRWIVQSVNLHFRDLKPSTWPLKYEDDPSRKHVNTGTHDGNTSVELRVDGPRFTRLSKREIKFKIEVNALVSVNITNDLYAAKRIQGEIMEIMDQCIVVKKYGSGPDDDSAIVVGTLRPLHDDRNYLDVNTFGQVDPNLTLQQSTVEAHYEMVLKET